MSGSARAFNDATGSVVKKLEAKDDRVLFLVVLKFTCHDAQSLLKKVAVAPEAIMNATDSETI